MPRPLMAETVLRESADDGGAALATLHPGDVFEVLDLAGGRAWGIAVALKLVGYIDAAALDRAT